MMNSTSVEYAIHAENLVVNRGRTPVLRGVDLALRPGTITGLLGPSGCGKTTLIRAIVGVQHITSGTLKVLGQPAGSPDLRRRIAYTSQSLSIYADISVRANAAHFARLVGAEPGAVDDALAAVELTEYGHRKVRELSGGQASRASLACALVGNPEILVLDEPTVGLDPLTRQSLWNYFRALAAEGRTLLISSHVMDEATRCDEVLLMREGRFLAHENIEDLMHRTGGTTPEDTFLRLIEEAS